MFLPGASSKCGLSCPKISCVAVRLSRSLGRSCLLFGVLSQGRPQGSIDAWSETWRRGESRRLRIPISAVFDCIWWNEDTHRCRVLELCTAQARAPRLWSSAHIGLAIVPTESCLICSKPNLTCSDSGSHCGLKRETGCVSAWHQPNSMEHFQQPSLSF